MKEDLKMGEEAESALPSELIDRDLSWLEFNRRVLHEALDDRTPLLERLMFLTIFTTNLDEFVMKRLGVLRRTFSEKESARDADSEPLGRRLLNIREAILPMLDQRAACFGEHLRPQLAAQGIHLLEWEDLSEVERQGANAYFFNDVFPILTPQAVDPSHPFPFMSNLSISLAVALRNPETGEKMFARVKVPKLLTQWLEVGQEESPGQRRFISLREIILHNLELLFPGMTILNVMTLRVTRNAEIDYEEEEEGQDLLELVSEEVRQRRLQDVVRLEHGPTEDRWLLDIVTKQLDLVPDQVYEMPDNMDYTDFRQIASLDFPALKYSRWTPSIPQALAEEDSDMFSLIRSGDVMVHHPYESFDASVARFVRTAVNDENVLAIKMTVYRTSDDSPFVPLLIQAAEQGKQVACVVELKARFDEHRNIRWANALEDAGVHVVYGVIGVKTHTKITIVVRREPDGLRSYVHIGSGNYNPHTAKVYTDLGLFTCRPEISQDVVQLFHALTGRSIRQDYKKLLVAPVNMKQRFLDMIDAERIACQEGRPAHIVGKMNQVQDPDIIRALYRASQAGVPVDLVVRGFCVLRPGVPEFSPTIRVVSVVGRFLEHSRIFYFRDGAEDPVDGKFFIGSADWMVRNLEHRVEAVAPIQDRGFRQRCWEILQLTLADRRQAWDMQPDGSYVQRQPTGDPQDPSVLGTQKVLMQWTRQRNEAS
ncbi:MAG: polyphosphate kinase 1 [Planctomycetales bacterium]|nr:polyphosphate kinase 1 [Planctomycetales bacterium]NIM07914.1 polyphosphate kinase 1 [Planctomycetales bacterium]NIN07401.1 polyphosphate kinase 1 [Planctomycetales bacterium]NIN76505.1 polyphosphate kinase 1 [Planctomycetales bacterium]NIO33695.1 polyphosphate kinase 1 [Planctomycetales bacterium]